MIQKYQEHNSIMLRSCVPFQNQIPGDGGAGGKGFTPAFEQQILSMMV